MSVQTENYRYGTKVRLLTLLTRVVSKGRWRGKRFLSLWQVFPKSLLRLRHQLLHYNSLDIRQPEFAPLEFISQSGVINAHQMQNGRVEVVNAHRIDHRVV